jgi:hypothetical protein
VAHLVVGVKRRSGTDRAAFDKAFPTATRCIANVPLPARAAASRGPQRLGADIANDERIVVVVNHDAEGENVAMELRLAARWQVGARGG